MLTLQKHNIQHNTMFSFPTPQPNLNSIKNPPDFTFCDVPKWKLYQEKHDAEDGATILPLPLWSEMVDSGYTCPPHAARLQAMVEGRKKLMEMMEDLPESCYELSLKDIVVEDQENMEIVIEEKPAPLWSKMDSSGHTCPPHAARLHAVVEGRKKLMEMLEDQESMEIVMEEKPERKDNKKRRKKGPVSRSISMDTGAFLLRMFTPSSFGVKRAKVSRVSSMDRAIKRPTEGEWLKTRFYFGSKDSFSSNTDSSCSSSSTKNRDAEGVLKRISWLVNKTMTCM